MPAHEALRLVVNSRAGHRPDDRPEWKRPRGRPRPRQTWICQLEIDVGLAADAAWDMPGDREPAAVQSPKLLVGWGGDTPSSLFIPPRHGPHTLPPRRLDLGAYGASSLRPIQIQFLAIRVCSTQRCSAPRCLQGSGPISGSLATSRFL